MKTWQIDNQTIYEIEPLREYLRALAVPTLRETQEQRLMLVIGEAGVGKTVGAQVFRQESVSPCAYINLPSEQLLQPRDILNLIADGLHLSTEFRGRLHLASYIIQTSHHQPWTVLLDGAQSLRRYQWLDLIRWLHDEGSHTFVLIGTPSLEQTFLDHRDLAGRVLLRHRMRLPTADEIAPLFDGFPREVVRQIHEETGGRMRDVVALRRWVDELMRQNKLAAEKVLPKQVQALARRFLLRVA